MANNKYTTVKECCKCARQMLLDKPRSVLLLLLKRRPLELLGTDVLGILPKTLNGNLFVLVVPDCYSKFKRAVTICKNAMSHFASCFMYNWIIPYVIPTHVLTDNGCSSSVSVWSFNAPFWERDISRLGRTIYQQMGARNYLIRLLLLDSNIV